MSMITKSMRTAALVSALLLAGCASDFDVVPMTTGALPELPPPSDERPQDEPLARGKFHYTKGSYGLAERAFREAVEANPKSAEAWLGLAASYDRLKRFDLADRAYKEVLNREGRTVAVLNNLAYHHMLKGEMTKASSLLREAGQKDPHHLVVAGNMKLLETWKTGEPH